MTIEPYFHVKDDTYCYPDSNVLRNLLGITDYDELVSAEGRLTMMAMTQLDVDPVKGCFDTEHLRTIHCCIFKDIYDWAGEFRTVEISKGIPSCYCANIQSQLDSIFAQLHKENLLKDITDKDQYVSRIAFYFGELNAVQAQNRCEIRKTSAKRFNNAVRGCDRSRIVRGRSELDGAESPPFHRGARM
ncbi:Fic/DOC family protein [Methanomethylophilus alvi]|uniref:Fic/DOC family protein n=2 Tax=Methanomethylophilus alvi TaxID=1291540 RepID=UPI0037DCE4AC